MLICFNYTVQIISTEIVFQRRIIRIHSSFQVNNIMDSNRTIRIYQIHSPKAHNSCFPVEIVTDEDPIDFIDLQGNKQGIENKTGILQTNAFLLPELTHLIPRVLIKEEIKQKREIFTLNIFSSHGLFVSQLDDYIKSNTHIHFMRVIIIINAIALLMFNYKFRVEAIRQMDTFNIVSYNLQLLCNVIFSIDVASALIVKGALFLPQSYFRNPWNVLSFVSTIACWIQIFFDPISSDSQIWFFLLFALKCLRILKFIEVFEPLRQLFEAFLRTIPRLGQTFFPLAIFLLFYSIVGLHLFSGANENRCRLTEFPINKVWQIDENVTNLCGSWECPSSTYCGSLYEAGLPANSSETAIIHFGYGLINFDYFFSAAFTVSHFIFMANWSAVMFQFTHYINKYVTNIYFVSLAIFLFYIISNLLLVSLYKGFIEEYTTQDIQKKTEVKKVKNKKKRFLITKVTPIKKDLPMIGNKEQSTQNSSSSNQKTPGKLDKYIKLISPLIIICSSVIICYDYDGISQKQILIANILDLVFTILFAAEMGLLIFLEKKQFFEKGIHVADLGFLGVNVIGLIYCLILRQQFFMTKNPTVALLKSIKILRILKIAFQIQFFSYQKQIISIFFSTLKKMTNFMSMWFAIVLTEAVIMMGLFGFRARFHGEQLNLETGEPQFQNFQGIYKSIIMIILSFQNQGWVDSLYLFYDAIGSISIFVYLGLTFLGHLMLIRLFMAVFLDYFIKEVNQAEKQQQQLKIMENKADTETPFSPKVFPSPAHELKEMSSDEQQNESQKKDSDNKYIKGQLQKSELQKSELILISSQNKQQNRMHHLQIQQVEPQSQNYFKMIKQKCFQLAQSHSLWKNVNYFIFVWILFRFTIFLKQTNDSSLLVKIFGLFVSLIYYLEFLINIIAYGFWKSENSYLKRAWINPINFLIVIACVLTNIVPSRIGQLLQKLTTARLLNIIYQDYIQKKEMQLIIESISKLAANIAKLIFLYFIFLLCLSILPLKLIKSIYYCENALITETLNDSMSCMDWGGDWITEDQNFSNIFNSLLLMYQIATTEGWVHYMQLCKQHFNNQGWDVFFVIFFFFFNFCMLGMFVGLIVEPYLEIKQKASKLNLLTPTQKTWFLIKNNINELIPQPVVQQPESGIRKKIYEFITITEYETFMDYLAYFNAIILAIYVFRASPQYLSFLDVMNTICLLIFILDTALKIIVAQKTYFYIPFSKLELIGTIFYLFQFTYPLYLSPRIYDSRIINALSVVFQLTRCCKLLLKFMWSRMLINAVWEIIPKCISVVKILAVILFIYAALGTHLFQYLKSQDTMDNYDLGFDDIFMSLTTLIKVATSQKWFEQVSAGLLTSSPHSLCNQIQSQADYLIYGKTGCGSLWAYPYYFSFHLIFSLVILNLFTASMLSAYNENYEKQYCSVNIFQLGDTLKYWKKYDPKGCGVIPYKKFWKLSSQIAIIFGVKKEELIIQENKQRFLKQLDLSIFENSVEGQKMFCFKFHDVITSFSKISMQIKSESEDPQEIQIEDPAIKNQIEMVQTKIPVNLYSNYKKVEKVNSAKMLILMGTLQKLRNWRSMAVLKQKKAVNQFLDIFKMKEKKDQNQRQNQATIASNIKIAAYIDEQTKRLTQ